MSTTDDHHDTAWRHTAATDSPDPDCTAFIPGNATLMVYDPASETGDAWLHAESPLDLRGWA